MEQHPMAEMAQEMARREQTGDAGPLVFIPGPEYDMDDPETREIVNMVHESYAQQNAEREARALRSENSALRDMLEANGIELPDHL
jgi:hypothetical protein